MVNRLRSRRLLAAGLGLVLILGAAGPALANYTTATGYTVEWRGGSQIRVYDPSGRVVYEGQGQQRDDGRLLPPDTSLVKRMRGDPEYGDIPRMGSYQSTNSNYSAFWGEVPIFRNGSFVGYGTLYTNPNTPNNAGQVYVGGADGSRWVREGESGTVAWNPAGVGGGGRVEISSGGSSAGTGGTSVSLGGYVDYETEITGYVRGAAEVTRTSSLVGTTREAVDRQTRTQPLRDEYRLLYSADRSQATLTRVWGEQVLERVRYRVSETYRVTETVRTPVYAQYAQYWEEYVPPQTVTRTVTVPVTRYRTETRYRTVTVRVPETRYRTETYYETVRVPVQRTRQEAYIAGYRTEARQVLVGYRTEARQVFAGYRYEAVRYVMYYRTEQQCSGWWIFRRCTTVQVPVWGTRLVQTPIYRTEYVQVPVYRTEYVQVPIYRTRTVTYTEYEERQVARTRQVPYTVWVERTVQEPYTVQVPYTDYETRTETVTLPGRYERRLVASWTSSTPVRWETNTHTEDQVVTREEWGDWSVVDSRTQQETVLTLRVGSQLADYTLGPGERLALGVELSGADRLRTLEGVTAVIHDASGRELARVPLSPTGTGQWSGAVDLPAGLRTGVYGVSVQVNGSLRAGGQDLDVGLQTQNRFSFVRRDVWLTASADR